MKRTKNPLIRTLASALPMAALSCALLAPNARAGLAQFETLQAKSNLVFQYKFEGSTDGARLADASGNGYTLQRTAGSGAFTTADVGFVSGFDGASQAYQPAFDSGNRLNGAGLTSVSTSVPLGTNLTLEAIIQLDSFTPPPSAPAVYIFAGRPSGAERAYALRQKDDAGTDYITTTFGDNNSDQPNVLGYTAGNWYYIALTADYDAGANITTVSWYGANLTANETTIQHYGTDNTSFTGNWTGSTQIGIGVFMNGAQEFMDGRLDNIAMTAGLVSSNAFQARLDALYLTPPASLFVSTDNGNGADAELIGWGGANADPTNAVDSANGTGINMNTRLSTNRNEVIAMRFDLSGYTLTDYTDYKVEIINYRDSNGSGTTLQFFGVNDNAVAEDNNTNSYGYTDDTWLEAPLSFSTMPGLHWTNSSTTDQGPNGDTVALGSMTHSPNSKGSTVSFSSAALTSFIQSHPDSLVTILVNRTLSGSGQSRMATREASALDGGSPSGSVGDFAPRLSFVLACQTAVITNNPSNQSIDVGAIATFSVGAGGSNPTYQWQVDTGGGFANVSTGTGGTTDTYMTDITTLADDGNLYRCIVSVACDSSSVTSAVATLTVSCNAAGIASQPVDQAVQEFSPAVFSLTATGSFPTYQWQVSTDGGTIWNDDFNSGYNTDTLTTPNTALANTGDQYRCIVSVACDSSSVTSAVATLTVLSQAVWTAGGGDTEWTNSNNWDILAVPNANYNVLIPASGYIVDYNTPAPAIHNIEVQGSTLNVNASGFTNTFLFVNTSSSGLINVNGGGDMTVNGNAAVNNTAGISVETGGSLKVTGDIIVGSGNTGGTGGTSDSISRGSLTNNGGTIIAGRTRINPQNRNAPNYLIINGGVNDLGDLDLHRQNSSSSSATTMRVNGGLVRTTSILLNGNSYVYAQQDGGVFTNAGPMTLQMDGTASRDLRYVQNSGYFVMPDPNVVTLYPNGASSSIRTYYIVNGGTNMVGGFQLGSDSTSPGIARVWNNSSLYIGSQGVTWDGAATVDFLINTGGILGATADWTSLTAPMALGTGAGGIIQCADLSGTPHNILLGGVLSGGSLTKTGGGTLTLAAANTYIGSTTISEGTLALAPGGSIASSSSIQVGAGATLDATAPGLTLANALGGTGTVLGNVTAQSGSSITPGSSIATLTFSNDLVQLGNVFNDFEINTASNDLVEVVGNLSFSGTNIISITSVGGFDPGTYTLFHYGGSLIGDVSNLSLVGAPGYLTNDATAQTIALVTSGIRGTTNVTWVGNSLTNDWDVFNLTNWQAGSSLSFFLQGDAVTFDDTGLANPLVNLAETVSPASTTVSASGDYTFTGAGTIAGGGGLTKSNSGKLTIENDHSYTGVTTISGGTLSVSNLADGGLNSPIGAAGVGSGNLVIDGGALEYTGPTLANNRGATLNAGGGTLAVTDAGATLTLNGTLTGDGSLTKAGPGVLHLTAANDYTNGTVLNAGTLRVENGNATGTGNLTLNGGTLDVRVTTYTANEVNVAANAFVRHGGTSGENRNIDGSVIGSATLAVVDGTLPTDTSLITINGNMQDFSGTIDLGNNAGRLRFNSGGSTPNRGSSNAVFNLGTGTAGLMNRNGSLYDTDSLGGNYYLGALTGGPGTFLYGAAQSYYSIYNIGGLNMDTTFEGTIKHDADAAAREVRIVKVGTGKLTLTGNSPYLGTTTVETGTLQVDGNIPNSAVTVNFDGTLAGSGTLGQTVMVNGTLAPGSSIGTLTILNDLYLNWHTVMEVDATSGTSDSVTGITNLFYNGDLVVTNLSGTLTNGAVFKLFSAENYYQEFYSGITLPTLAGGLVWQNNLYVDGTIRIAPLTTAPSMTTSVSGSQLTLNWPATHTGWTLQAQTNNLATGLTSAWTDIPDTDLQNSYTTTIDPANPTVFYRLTYVIP